MKSSVPAVSVIAFCIMVAMLASAVASAAPPSRPNFDLTTDRVFDPGAVPAYRGNHDEVYAYIDEHLDRHVEALQRWVRQPSISAQNVGVVEMAEMLRDDLKALGFAEAELVETDGHPGVWGYYDAGAEKTLMMYMMYDVQQFNEEDRPDLPFAGNLVDYERGKVLMAHGASNRGAAAGASPTRSSRCIATTRRSAGQPDDYRGRRRRARFAALPANRRQIRSAIEKR